MWERVRGAIVRSLIWGAAWGGAGGVLARFHDGDSDLPFPLMFAPLGVATGIVFSGLLLATKGRHGLERMSFPAVAALGAASGLLLSAIIGLGAALRGDAVWPELQLFGPPLAAAGAGSAALSLAFARRAQRRGHPGDGARTSAEPAEH